MPGPPPPKTPPVSRLTSFVSYNFFGGGGGGGCGDGGGWQTKQIFLQPLACTIHTYSRPLLSYIYYTSLIVIEKRCLMVEYFQISAFCMYKRFLSCLDCSSGPSTNYFYPHRTLFHLKVSCPHHPASWAGSRAGSPVS